MANSTTVTTVTWYLTVPDLRPTLAALSIRARKRHAVQVKGNVLQILSQFWEKLLLAEPPLNPNPRMVWGTCQQECTQHNSRMESFKPSVDQEKVRWKQAHAQ